MTPILRADAKRAGLKRYFTGQPCCRGHVVERLVCDYSCVECSRLDARDPENRTRRREYMRQHARRWRAKNADRWTEIDRASKAKNAPKYAEHKRKVRAADPEPARQSLRKSYTKHKDRRAVEMKAYRKKNPERMAVLSRAYKAKKRAAEGRYSFADVRRMFDAQSGRCNVCKTDIANLYHIDHVVPLSRGGTNWPSNLQLLCQHCNLSKNDSDMSEWLARKHPGLAGVHQCL